MNRILAIAITAGFGLTGCATTTQNSIREVMDESVTSCTLLGNISGADSIFVGLSASVGRKNAKARAMNQALELNATDIVWSEMGTSMTNEWLGKAYRCQPGSASVAKAIDLTGPSIISKKEASGVVTDSAAIREIQNTLREKGLFSGKVDGLFGPQTRMAIEKYQRVVGLPVDGVPSIGLLEQLRR